MTKAKTCLPYNSFERPPSLRYLLFGGSLVGLYHNAGPLPWDDDVDVLMTEADTLKLIELVVNQRVINIFRMIKTFKIS